MLDGTLCEIQTFEVTEYGRLINEATALRYDGDEVSAVGIWERVLELDENNELAHVGIGKAYLTAGDYKQAMKHLRIGMAREYYSVAYRRYRNEMLRKGASAFLSCIVILAIALLATRRFRKKERRR